MSKHGKHIYSTFRAAFISGVIDEVYGPDDEQDSPIEPIQAAPAPEPEEQATGAERAWLALQCIPA